MASWGCIPWDKGLTKDDPRIASIIAKRRATMLVRYGVVVKGRKKGSTFTLEAKTRMSESAKKRWQRERDKIIEAQNAGKASSPTFSKANSERMKKQRDSIEVARLAGLRRWIEGGMMEHLSRISKRSTKIELMAQASLIKVGISFLANKPVANWCIPDLILMETKVAIFMDGCYWHGCPLHFPDRSEKHEQIDKTVNGRMRSKGWQVIRVWEHEIKENPNILVQKLTEESTLTIKGAEAV